MKPVLELSHIMLSPTTTRILLLAVVAALCGCARGKLYQASSLPPELVAPQYATLQNVDLSRLARTVSNSQVLYMGDEVAVTVATGLEKAKPLAWKGRVAEDGTVTVPIIGMVQVAGLEIVQAEQAIRNESIRRGKYVAPNVTLLLTQRRTNSVAVLGAVAKPGTLELSASSSDLLSAIVQAGGLSPDAGTIIEIRHPPGLVAAPVANNGNGFSTEFASRRGNRRMVRTPPRTVQVDLTEAARSDFGDYSLVDGSTVMVMQRPKRFIHVMGLVNRSNQYQIPKELEEPRLLDAISMAGGRKLSIADKVHIIRQLPDRAEPVVIEASVSAAKRDTSSNIRLAAGDVISVEETPTTFVVGTIRDFINIGTSIPVPGL